MEGEVAKLSDRFSNSQKVWAGDGLLKATLIKKWYAEAGFRLGGDFYNMIPTATLTRKLTSDQNLSMSYTKRITRPFIFDMNLNIDASDP